MNLSKIEDRFIGKSEVIYPFIPVGRVYRYGFGNASLELGHTSFICP